MRLFEMKSPLPSCLLNLERFLDSLSERDVDTDIPSDVVLICSACKQDMLTSSLHLEASVSAKGPWIIYSK